MTTYYLGAAASFILSLGLTSLLANYARRSGSFIPPFKPRDSHTSPTPRIGGLAIVMSFFIVIIGWLLFDPTSLQLTKETIGGVDRNLLGLLVAIALLTFINVQDDYTSVHWIIKLTFQVLASLVIAFFGIKLLWVTNPFGSPIILGSFGIIFLLIWLVTIANVVNWLDGIDGLAGGVSTIALIILFFLSINPTVNQPANALIAAITIGAVLGFLPYNFRSKVFLGDTGSVFLGFIIGVLAVISGGKMATAFLVLAIPFVDAVVVFFTRLLRGHSPFLPDRLHLHHKLLSLGLKRWQIVLIFYGVSLLFGLIALNTQSLGKFWAIMAALGLMLSFVLIYSVTTQLPKPKDGSIK